MKDKNGRMAKQKSSKSNKNNNEFNKSRSEGGEIEVKLRFHLQMRDNQQVAGSETDETENRK